MSYYTFLTMCNLLLCSRYFNVGWAGSSHDQHVLKNSNIFLKSEDFFLEHEYILGDSAYECVPFLLPVYKKPPRSSLTLEKENFNRALAHQ
jgi:hypothetical protein